MDLNKICNYISTYRKVRWKMQSFIITFLHNGRVLFYLSFPARTYLQLKPAFTTECRQKKQLELILYLSGSCVATTKLNRLKKEGSLSSSFSGLWIVERNMLGNMTRISDNKAFNTECKILSESYSTIEITK